MENKRKRRGFVFVAATVVLALGAFVALNWNSIAFSAAVLLAEQRPDMFSDAEWGKPETARKFNARYHKGGAAVDLVTWLKANEFEVDTAQRKAVRRIRGLPCNELIEVEWQTLDGGILGDVRAVVCEAGCL